MLQAFWSGVPVSLHALSLPWMCPCRRNDYGVRALSSFVQLPSSPLVLAGRPEGTSYLVTGNASLRKERKEKKNGGVSGVEGQHSDL